ncbi:right-handed parallel beta-helix repeat-containing protein, partial [Crocinitomix algicola]|uniref:hypothetical protein n=1 Tax=Crocinitomix algicola TaxID=1740263 RepID=UPI0009F441B5
MNKISIILIILISSILSFGQTIKPKVAWRYHDIQARITNSPIAVQHIADIKGATNSFVDSGEDWWYDIQNIYEGGVHVGYILCGFTSWQNISFDESELAINPGCRIKPLSSVDCDRPIVDDREIGPKVTTVGRYDLQGNMVWCRAQVHAEEGAMAITTTSDGGSIFTGWSESTRTLSGEPIYYNPTSSDPDTDVNDHISDCLDYRFKMIVGKVDANGNTEWVHAYGNDLGIPELDEEILSTSSIGYDVIEIKGSDPVQYRVVGRCEDMTIPPSGGVRYTKGFVVDIDEDGLILNKSLIGNGAGYTDFREIIQSKDDLDEFYVTGYGQDNTTNGLGTGHEAILIKIDENQVQQSFGNTTWNGTDAFIESPTSSTENNVGWDVKMLENGKIVWAYLDNATNGLGGGFENYGNAKILLIDPSDESYTTIDMGAVNTYGFSEFRAFDLKVGLTETQDGGFALLSTYRTSIADVDAEPYVTYLNDLDNQISGISCSFNSNTYRTDAYVAKFNENGNLLWDKSFDADPAGSSPYPGDIKEQECVYRITEADDGSLVLTGNTSHNSDDYYIAKLHSDCQIIKYTNNEFDLDGYTEPITIDYDITWTDGIPVSGDVATVAGKIIVKNGSTLTIDGMTLKFADSRKMNFETKLIVEPGAKLRLINGAKLTSYDECENSMWSGVEVHGLKGEPQTEFYQGVLEMNDATIENAIIGVSTVERIDNVKQSYSTGGILRIENSNFENNLIAIEMRPYQNVDVYDNIIDNVSFIKKSSFLIDEELNDREIAYVSPLYNTLNGHRKSFQRAHQQFVLLHGIRGVKIEGCDFEIDETYGENIDRKWKGYGILSWDSSFKLRKNHLYVGDPSPTPNTFSNLEIGVYAKAITTANDVIVDGCIFDNNHFGVAFEGKSGFSKIINNEFNVDEHDHPAVYGSPFQNAAAGVYLENTTGFAIENNSFDGIAQSVTDENAGVFIKNSSALLGFGGEIYRNTFEKFDVTLQSTNDNSLLAVDCNDFKLLSYVNPKWTWHNANGEVMNQGFCPELGDPDPEAPQANKFIGTYSGTNYQLNNEGPAFEYNHYPEAAYTPTNYVNVAVDDCDGDPFPGSSTACPARSVTEDIVGFIAEIDDLDDAIADVIADIDNGDNSQETANLLTYLQNEKLHGLNLAASYYVDSAYFDDAVQLLENHYTINASSLLLPILVETENTAKLNNHIDSIRTFADLNPTSPESENLYAMADFYELTYEIQTQTGGVDSITAVQVQELTDIVEDSTVIAVNAANYLALLDLKEVETLYLEPLPGEQQYKPQDNNQGQDKEEIV